MLPGFTPDDRADCLPAHSKASRQLRIRLSVAMLTKDVPDMAGGKFRIRVTSSTWWPHVRTSLRDHVPRVFFRCSGEEMGGVATQRIVAIRAVVAGVLIVRDLANCRHQGISVRGDGSSPSVSHDKEVSVSTIRRARRPWPARVWSARSIDVRPKQLSFIAMATDALALSRARLSPFVALRAAGDGCATNGTRRIFWNWIAQSCGAAIRATCNFWTGGMEFLAARRANFGNLEAHRRLQSEVPRPRSLAARGGLLCPNYTIVTRTIDLVFPAGGVL